MKKIIFTGGGTVGHVTLNLLLIPKFLDAGWQVHYIGDKHGIEYKEIKKSGLDITFHSIATGKLRRYFSWQNMLDIFKVTWGILQSLGIMVKVRPQVLFSKGGFVSVPPVIAARLSRVPVYVHESDLSIGLANKIAYKCATKMYSTFEQAHALTKIEHVGAVTKVGEKITAPNEQVQRIQQHFDKNLPTLLFVGGSAGAKVFNDLVTENKIELTQHYNVINLSGDAHLDELSNHLYRVAYVTDLYQPLMNLADVVITRGGSNTIFELLAMAKLHVIVPLGREASRGDQIENADYFVKKGYAKKLDEGQLNFENLQKVIAEMLERKEMYERTMKQSHEIKSLDEFYNLLTNDIDKGRK